jgi:D-proline reductase (dithiol) PrdB
MALDLLESARRPRTTVQTPFVWSEDESWKQSYARVDPERLEALRRAGERRRAKQTAGKAQGRTLSGQREPIAGRLRPSTRRCT